MKSNDQKLANIDFELRELEKRKQTLLAQRKSIEQMDLIPISQGLLTPDEKVNLFASLFRGRLDIHATKWTNKVGKSGFSVACHNEWVQNICEKPKIKCSDCSNRAYKALDTQALFSHLSGKAIVGLYPLLPDNTCYFLAADFDKQGWQQSVKAMASACEFFELPYAIEISQSGNGAHLWIFFETAISATKARKIGFGLLNKAMELQPSISFDSYDRLFPNQDIMPVGGFGNLIALPLQKIARKNGFSEFVDKDLHRIDDQWRFLGSLKKLFFQEVESTLSKMGNIDKVEHSNDENTLPWDRDTVFIQQFENLPSTISVTLANLVYIPLCDIPTQLAAQLKRIASFSNPIFFKQQALRFSTHGTPRIISYAYIDNGLNNTQWLSMPRGCLDNVLDIFTKHKIAVSLIDKRTQGKKLSHIKFLGIIKKEQTKATKVMCEHDTGILHAPTAFGKTVTAIRIITKRKTNTLILTHSKQLLEQWQERLKSFLVGVEIGVIGGGKKKPRGEIDVATYQSFINRKENTIDPMIREYGQVIVDECHHISAANFTLVLNEVNARYVLGLTATPYRQDGLQKLMFMLAGPIRHKVSASKIQSYSQTVQVIQLGHLPPTELIHPDKRPHISDVYKWLTNSESRNETIVNDVKQAIDSNQNPLVLTERRDHAQLLHQLLVNKGFDALLLVGAMKAKDRVNMSKRLDDSQVIIATGKFIGEGFDLPKLDALFLAMPIAWKGTLAQYAGRIHREYEGKQVVTIFDYVDTNLPMLARMFTKREKGYKNMGYTIRVL
jgi:superfamily II DNA or RNA helicase